ncbi:MAG: serine protease, partial [Chitinophagaceae bacterium]
VLSTKETDAEGVVFDIKAKYIHQMIQELNNENNASSSIKISSRSALKGIDKVTQVKRIQDFVYMLKVY